jgi:hypothetical protein
MIVLIFGQTPAAVNNIFVSLNVFVLGNPSGLAAVGTYHFIKIKKV